MNDTASCSLIAPQGQGQAACDGLCPAKRETFQSAVKPSGPMACRAGRKRPWNDGCGQSARIETVVSAPSGAMANPSEPPSSSENENGSMGALAPGSSGSGTCKPPASAASAVPGTKS